MSEHMNNRPRGRRTAAPNGRPGSAVPPQPVRADRSSARHAASPRNRSTQSVSQTPIRNAAASTRRAPVASSAASQRTVRMPAGSAAMRTTSMQQANGSQGARDGYAAHSRYAFEAEQHAKPKMSKGKKIAIAVFAVLFALLAGAGVAIGMYVSKINANLGFEDDTQLSALKDVLAPAPAKDEAFYMLVIGSDARGQETSRSDVLMLARIDAAEKTVHLISIPRDTMVDIEGYGTNKINAAYAYGGPALAVKTVSAFAGVPISHYAEISFTELESLVDLLGGVTVNVPEAFTSKVTGVSLSAGEQTLNGQEALAFVRERKAVSGGDFGRAQAQRQVAEAIIKQILAPSPMDLPGVVTEAAKCVSTDWGLTDVISLAMDFQGGGLKMYSAACPSYAHSVDGVSYVCPRFDEWKTLMQRVDAGMDPKDEESEIPVEQLNNEELGAGSNSPAPRDYYDIAANAMSTDDVAQIDE